MKLILSGMLKRILKILMTAVLFMVLLANLGAGSMKMDKGEIQVTGKVYLMGGEPFTYVGIQLDDGKVYALIGEHEKELRSLQGKRLTVKGKVGGKKTRGVEAIEVKSFKVMESK
jgi:hypothetical protein